MKQTITAHMMVKNDDQWVWYAIQSILPYVDTFLITDTGSSDRTVEFIQSINSPKIVFHKQIASSAKELVAVRQEQLRQTKTDWLWMIDGDELFLPKVCKEIVAALSPDLAGIVVRRYDCLGDIFHYQPDEKVGGYSMFGETAHFSLRLINCHLQGLALQGEYPNEGFVDKDKTRLLDYPKNRFYITSNRFIHTTYLKRSSLGGNLLTTIHRQKYKVEWGRTIPKTVIQPILELIPPDKSLIPAPRGLRYTVLAALLTPIKMIKRKLIK